MQIRPKPQISCVDVRQANNVEFRPSCTYIRVAPALDDSVFEELDRFSKRGLPIGAFAIAEGPNIELEAANRLVSIFGSVAARQTIGEAPGRSLHTIGLMMLPLPEYILIFFKSITRVVVADFGCVWWRLLDEEIQNLRKPDFCANSTRCSVVTGDPGNPQIRYDPKLTLPTTGQSTRALSTLELALKVPGVQFEFTMEPRSILILDNWRILAAFRDDLGGEGEVVMTTKT